MSKTLTITFEDTDQGLMLSCTPEVREAMYAVLEEKEVTVAEGVAGLTWAHLMNGVLMAAGPDGITSGETKEEVMKKLTEEKAKEAECGGDCANCTYCQGNRTIN